MANKLLADAFSFVCPVYLNLDYRYWPELVRNFIVGFSDSAFLLLLSVKPV